MCTAAAAHVETHPLSSIKGYVTIAYDGCCWLGMEARVVEVNFLHPQLPSNSYGYPQRQDVMEVDPSDILTCEPLDNYRTQILLNSQGSCSSNLCT